MTATLPLFLAFLIPGMLAGRPATQAPPKGGCVDENRLIYSAGSLRKVAGQIQKCDAAKWILDEMNGPKDPKLEKAKPCQGVMNQAYAAGVLRPVGEKPEAAKIERCDDGKWVPHVVKRPVGTWTSSSLQVVG